MSVSSKYTTAFTGGVPKAGFKNVGNIAIDTDPGSGDYSIANFIGGILGSYDSSGYVIISDTTTAGVNTRTTANHTGVASANTPTYWVSPTKDDAGFLLLFNKLPMRKGLIPLTDPFDASVWLRMNGYWTSYVTPVLSLDAANYTSGSWVDSIGGKQFTLYNGPQRAFNVFNPSTGQVNYYFNFVATSSQYAECSTSLPDLNNWTVGVWHFYDGTNVGPYPTIITEFFPGVTAQINYSLGWNFTTTYLNSGFFDGAWRVSSNYTLTPNSWYYIVGTYDGATLNMYVNNTLVSTSSYSGTPISGEGGIRLMRRWDDADYWGGKLAKVDIYDGALGATQISNIWNQNKVRFGL